MNIFEQAARNKLRFLTTKGFVMTEDLWDIPLTSKSGFDLDTIAKSVNTQLKSHTEESFVKVSNNPLKDELTLQLEILKFVIADHQATVAARVAAQEAKEKREKLLAALSKKQDMALENLSVDELKAQIEALS